jgi:protoheme IX farnesyltransferase
MLFAVNVVTGVLGLVALVSYVAIYTPMKRYTWLALLVGAIPGAMPPLMGWTTVTGSLDIGGLLLFGVLFLWQVPHFSAITLFRRDDYANAGLKVVSVDRGERGAKHVVVLYTVLLVANTLLLYPFHVGGARYLAVAAVLGAVFLALGVRGLVGHGKNAGTRWAKQLFGFSILYLVALLAALLLDRAGA